MTHAAAFVPSADTGVLGLYVHLPWCARKCPYCDFNSFELRGGLPQADYVAALLNDLRFESRSSADRTIGSIYIGGGTPSLFSAEQIGRLLEGIHSSVSVVDSAEITLEANPGTIETRRLAGLRAAGVNRVSIGVQSLRDDRLQELGRVHDAAEARRAVATALAAGFDSVNLDLMYGLPGDGVAEGLQDLAGAVSLGTPHLSWYQLTLEPNTAWQRRPPAGLPDDEVLEALEREGRDMLRAAGLIRYEVSAYARPGHECAHNLNYWRFGDYIGIGAGAHGKRRLLGAPGHVRYGKRRNPLSYMRTAGTVECVEMREIVAEPRAIALEYLMNALRLLEGTTPECFAAETGVDPSDIAAALQLARNRGLLAATGDRMRATDTGMQRLNEILQLVC